MASCSLAKYSHTAEYAAVSLASAIFKIARIIRFLFWYRCGSFGICLVAELLIYARFSLYSIDNLRSLRELRKLVSFPYMP